jgi:hypothetical protein|eukprot:COSAG06_NODE_2729_length_6378_cov_1.791846_3_plen_63_part_00
MRTAARLFGLQWYVREPGVAFWIQCASTPEVILASTAPSSETTMNILYFCVRYCSAAPEPDP